MILVVFGHLILMCGQNPIIISDLYFSAAFWAQISPQAVAAVLPISVLAGVAVLPPAWVRSAAPVHSSFSVQVAAGMIPPWGVPEPIWERMISSPMSAAIDQ
jgi:endonuclease/exonuclease/phosphatase (EEP) superfamily protein YafD